MTKTQPQDALENSHATNYPAHQPSPEPSNRLRTIQLVSHPNRIPIERNVRAFALDFAVEAALVVLVGDFVLVLEQPVD